MSSIPAEVTPAILPKRRQTVVGAALAAGASAMVVVLLVGNYLEIRSASDNFFDGVSMPLAQPNVMFWGLGLSVLSIQWAVWAIARDERSQAYWAMAITMLLGLSYLNSTWYLMSQSELAVGVQPEAGATFAVVGAHVAMVIVALAMVAVMAFRTVGGQFSSRYPDGWSAAAVYWHTMVGAYVLVWYAVYVTK
ncbi:MAG: cytochrome c oxidase subunit 3 [Microthrixaceae bacterium]|nr:cytochrome c oxidase subunit 3 [Microthrixaceae bacterium]